MNKTLTATVAAMALLSTAAVAETRVTYKSAKSTSSPWSSSSPRYR